MMQKRWLLAPAAPADDSDISPALAQILHNRGFADKDAAMRFLHDRDLLESPFDMKDMRPAVERIRRAIADSESLAVYGDYDADGVCATALLLETLQKLGAKAQAHIPHRDDGYGLNAATLRRLAGEGVALVVTVDCGIRSVAEVAAGKAAGLDIIISDHHSLGAELPAALAVVNPRRDGCPGEARLSGCGVAFMLAQALLLDRWTKDRDNYPKDLRLSDLLDLVALGTVADVMPLDASLNRRLIAHGLDVINAGRRPGMAALAAVSGLRLGEVRASDLAFRIGPRINAAGRLGSADTALKALMAKTGEQAQFAAERLQHLNLRRQQLTSDAQAAVNAQMEQLARETAHACLGAVEIIARCDRQMARLLRDPDPRLAVARLTCCRRLAIRAQRECQHIADPARQWRVRQIAEQWRAAICKATLASLDSARRRITARALSDLRKLADESDTPALLFAATSEDIIPAGIAGLVAGRLTEAHYRPAVIVALGEGECRASCRSIPEFNITRALDDCAHLLIRHGGHAQAAGFSVHRDNLPALRKLLERLASKRLRGKTLAPTLRLDAELDTHDWNMDTLRGLAALEPTGANFPPATFMTRDLRVASCRAVGGEGKHLKLSLSRNGRHIDAIGFGMGEQAHDMPGSIDAAYHLEMNEFNGRRSLQLHLLDIRPAQS